MVFGQIDSVNLFLMAGVFTVALVGAVTDLFRGKIYNWLTLPAVLVGLAASGWFYGRSGLTSATLAVGLGFLLYGWMYFLGAMAAGDVKFLMAFAAWGGRSPVHFVVDTAILGVLLGAVLAMISLAVRGRLFLFLRKLWRFLYSAFLSATSPDFNLESPAVDRTLTIPFGVPLAIAASWAAWADPLARWGMGLWSR